MRGQGALRSLDAPVRALPEALEDVTRSLLVQFVDPAATVEHRLRIVDRLLLVRIVAGEQIYGVLADRVQSALLTL